MPGIIDDLAGLDRIIHEPARLAILTALSACKSADFLFLQRLIGLTPGNLSSHLTKLEEAGLLWTDKQILARRPHTQVGLTGVGRTAIERHWQQLEDLRRHAQEIGSEGLQD